MKTRIISAFPGCGKTHFHKNNKKYKTLDSDFSNFSWVKDKNGNNTKVRNPNFPKNYIEHIKNNIGKYDFIFVSSHKEVRDALLEECIFFYLLYPQYYNKEKYLKRYRERGSTEGFIQLINNNWDSWIHELSFVEVGCERIIMVFDYLEQEIDHIIRKENGEK